MRDVASRLQSWATMQAAGDAERERLAILNKPPPANPPELLAMTKVKVLIPFYVAGKLRRPGEIVEIQLHDAKSLAALRKIEIL